MKNYLKILSGSSNPELAEEISNQLDISPTRRTIVRASNDNIKVKIEESVREDDVFVVQTSSPPVNDHLIELLMLIDALKYASARRITAVLPYYPYVRSDKKDEPRISISARLVADLLQAAGADRILTITLHSPQIVAFSRIPVDQLWATGLICDFMRRQNLGKAVVVSPDVGSADEAGTYARRLDLPLAIMDKRRHADDEKAEIQNIIGDIDGRDALLFDDEVLTGGSMMEAIRILKDKGARRILAGCTHGIFSGQALQRIDDSPVEVFATTNTIPLPTGKPREKIEVLSVARLLSDSIKAIHHGESVSRIVG
ncbi:MAG: ribose-phosphate diphosphokinase [Betaproteobacteria bacterium]|jgi:ribose-phosphate pyrophosphokinase|nr:ribose-phosphate diphosphokinase [Betaproteobacteria bacterium]MBT4977682.1 ribose-phosphate diphosphokinase [Gemmatimonadota bacterium]MBT5804635.1 ribose-phosphate diphosphokinase [Gemmatimonadota bacterium]MBT6905144.1 ribose-phosphate diphosphokinase [Gemmatimonadota bacterium]MBT7419310.1 ribose-phosphate diphosphokinase [Gemmatimonadota bacterium]